MEWYLFDRDELLNLQDYYHIVFTDTEYLDILTSSVKNVIKFSNEIIGTLGDYYISTCILMDSRQFSGAQYKKYNNIGNVSVRFELR